MPFHQIVPSPSTALVLTKTWLQKPFFSQLLNYSPEKGSRCRPINRSLWQPQLWQSPGEAVSRICQYRLDRWKRSLRPNMPKGTEMFRQSKEASTIFWPAKKVKYVSNTIQNQILDPRNKLPTDFRILLSSLSRYSQEPKWKRIFESLRVLFEKVLVFYSD